MNRFKNQWEQMFVRSDDENAIPGSPVEGEEAPVIETTPAPSFTREDVQNIVTQAVTVALEANRPQTPVAPVAPVNPGAPLPTMEQLRQQYANTDDFGAQAGVVEQMIQLAVQRTRAEVQAEMDSKLSNAEFSRQSVARTVINKALPDASEDVRAEAVAILSQYPAAAIQSMQPHEIEMAQALAEKRAAQRQAASPKAPTLGRGAPTPPATEKPRNPEVERAAKQFGVSYEKAESWLANH